jgi:hypothetical protein
MAGLSQEAVRHYHRQAPDLSETAIAHHAQVTGLSSAILMRGTGRAM